MTFEEAKQRNDYKYMLNGIEDCIEKIRNNWMGYCDETKSCGRKPKREE